MTVEYTNKRIFVNFRCFRAPSALAPKTARCGSGRGTLMVGCTSSSRGGGATPVINATSTGPWDVPPVLIGYRHLTFGIYVLCCGCPPHSGLRNKYYHCRVSNRYISLLHLCRGEARQDLYLLWSCLMSILRNDGGGQIHTRASAPYNRRILVLGCPITKFLLGREGLLSLPFRVLFFIKHK